MYLRSGIGPLVCGRPAAAPAWVSNVVRQIGQDIITVALLFARLGGVSSHASSSTTACPRCGFAPPPPPPPPRGNSFLCPTSINNAFCDPLKLAKNIPPPAATRVVTQSPPIEFDSLFHSVSQSVVRSHLASEPIISYHSRPVRPPPLPPRRLVVSYPQAVGIFRAHVLTAWHFSIYGTAFGQV